MSTVARIVPVGSAVAPRDWFGLVETGLRVILVAAAPVSAAIFVAQCF